jgi:hypothetical protein
MLKRHPTFWIAFALIWLVTLPIQIDEWHKPGSEPEPIRVWHFYAFMVAGVAHLESWSLLVAVIIGLTLMACHCAVALLAGYSATWAWWCFAGYTATESGVEDTISTTPVAWYDAAQYDRLLAAAADADCLEPTFEAWEHKSAMLVDKLEQSGKRIARVLISVDDLVQWAENHSRPVDCETRAQYVAAIAGQTTDPSHPVLELTTI